jgi:magnesium-transporting ATPase (P-type)
VLVVFTLIISFLLVLFFHIFNIILGQRVLVVFTLIISFLLVLFFHIFNIILGARGGVMVKALRYKPAGRGFDSRWCR